MSESDVRIAALRGELSTLDRRRAEDELIERRARGVAAVERVLRRQRERPSVWPVPCSLGEQLGWPLCGVCGRHIEPAWQITWGAGRFHPQCVGERIEARAG